MFPVERRKAILEILDKRNSVSVEELSKTLFTGEATVRRDLDKMAREGIITRTHGGAVRLQNENIDYPLSFRESENGRVKDELCAAAAQLVSDGQSLFLDGSSTVIRIIGKIAFKKRLKIITNGVKTAYELSQAGIDTVCTGGTLSVASASLTGVETVNFVNKYNVDSFFFSCRALSLDRGISESSEEVAQVKRAMAMRARRNILLADAGKFGKTAFCSLDIMDLIGFIITDAPLSEDWRRLFNKHNIKVIVV
ncbi:MAG: DeoR/GlpR family DNA-binding transcription regulator [Christensenellales bacterium]